MQDKLWFKIAKNLNKNKDYRFFITSHNKPVNLKFKNNFVDLCELNNFEDHSIYDKDEINLSTIFSSEQYLKLKGIYTSAAARGSNFSFNSIGFKAGA